MTQLFAIHPDNPQARLLRQAVYIIKSGGLVIYPTDSGYALGCQLGDKKALQRIRLLRHLDSSHHMTLLCRDLSNMGKYAHVNNTVFRILKAFTPGPYTFILKGSREVPRLMLNPKRKTLGIRVPDNSIALALLEALEEPLMSTTLILPGAGAPLSLPQTIKDVVGNRVDLIIDGGECSHEPTSIIDLSEDLPVILRRGKGDVSPFE